MDEWNQTKMKYIEGSGWKTIFHLGGLETDELAEGMKESVPTDEEDPREAPYEPLKPPVARGRSWERGAPSRTLSEESKVRMSRQWFRGLNTPGPTPGRTLSGLAGLCPVMTFCRDRTADLRFFIKFWRSIDCIALIIYIYRTWSPINHYINLTMIRVTWSNDQENPRISQWKHEVFRKHFVSKHYT
jgi:hypothetical protein